LGQVEGGSGNVECGSGDAGAQGQTGGHHIGDDVPGILNAGSLKILSDKIAALHHLCYKGGAANQNL